MSTILQNSIWPNADGNLGEIKVQIPDGTTTPWPDGDVFVNNFVFKNGELVGFVDTKALVANDLRTTTFPYDYVNIQVDKSLEDVMTFNRGERTKYLNIRYRGGNKTIEETFDFVIIDFNTTDEETINTVRTAKRVVDNKLYDADGGLIGTWDSSKIEVGGFFDLDTNIVDGLFCNVETDVETKRGLILSEFDSDLSSLKDGTDMFMGCSNLISFNSNLSSLMNGFQMFAGCENLTSFTFDLPKLTVGTQMFIACSQLTSFISDLSSLTNGWGMFAYCKLDTTSVQNIADTIKDVTSLTEGSWPFDEIYKLIQIDIANSTPNEQEKAAFNTIASKGWTVTVNGSDYTPTSPVAITTLDENGEETVTPIPFWAKPIPSDEKSAKYVDTNGNFYNILGAQFIYGDNLETYGMFTCEEDAAANMRLTKIN